MSELMTLEQTAEYLHLHPVTVRNKARKGEIPAVKVGRQWRFMKDQIEAWLLGGANKPVIPKGGLLAYVRKHREQIEEVGRQYGASNFAVFGSAARREDDADSDVDLLIDLEPGRNLFDLAGLHVDLEELLGRSVDVGTRKSLRERIRDQVLAETVPL